MINTYRAASKDKEQGQPQQGEHDQEQGHDEAEPVETQQQEPQHMEQSVLVYVKANAP